MNDKNKPYLPFEVKEGYFDKKNKLVRIVSKYDLDSSNVFVFDYTYDKKGRIIKMTEKALHDPNYGSLVKFVRNKKGLLLKIEFYRKGKLYMFTKLDYIYN